MSALECARCEETFELTDPHTELVRRDYVDGPAAPKMAHLCEECWRAYVEEFLGNQVELLAE